MFLLVAHQRAADIHIRIQQRALLVRAVLKSLDHVEAQVVRLVVVIGTEIAMFIVHKLVTTIVEYLQQQRALHFAWIQQSPLLAVNNKGK